MPSSKLSDLAETLIGSEIVKLGADIKEKIRQGTEIFNYTIGDFDSAIFPIPTELEDEIVAAYHNHHTTYPPAEGIAELRESVATFIRTRQGLDFKANEILIAAGGRPLIYTAYRAIVNKGDKVIYGVPSWNNNHYVHFTEGEHIIIESRQENNFMPAAAEIAPHLKGATLVALCSPLNPTGTAFSKNELEDICDVIIKENEQRGSEERKLFLLFDQIYWTLTYGKVQHYDPVSLRPEMRAYTIFIDGISKAFASTGVRVGWAMGPADLIQKMKAINSHLGAWAPMAEQNAVAKYLLQTKEIDNYLTAFKTALEERLIQIYNGLQKLKNAGYSVDAISPQAAIYLTIQIDLVGKITPTGKLLAKQADVTAYLLDEAQLAVVPFSAFGAAADSNWYRLSVGTAKLEDIPLMLKKLRDALDRLTS
ncbi:MAG: aminotransferase class I/II-fold pyridoxal phosphate-dependent enzyme [Ferruginibacter sp.]